MKVDLELIEDGLIHCATVSGKLDAEETLRKIEEMIRSDAGRTSKAFLIDFEACDLSHLSSHDLQDLSIRRNKLRAKLGDARPTGVVAPQSLTFGLAQIGAAYDDAPIQVFRDRASAIAWIDTQVGGDQGD